MAHLFIWLTVLFIDVFRYTNVRIIYYHIKCVFAWTVYHKLLEWKWEQYNDHKIELLQLERNKRDKNHFVHPFIVFENAPLSFLQQ